MQWAVESLLVGVEWPGHEADLMLTLRMGEAVTLLSLYALMACAGMGLPLRSHVLT